MRASDLPIIVWCRQDWLSLGLLTILSIFIAYSIAVCGLSIERDKHSAQQSVWEIRSKIKGSSRCEADTCTCVPMPCSLPEGCPVPGRVQYSSVYACGLALHDSEILLVVCSSYLGCWVRVT
jgi:hypothetical protein